ncbi:MAG: crosslink repair DNA glycosylase YcaQ family protein [Rubripirellula sp.]
MSNLVPLKIRNRDARRLWLTAQGLAAAPVGEIDTLQVIRDLGFVQLDTIQVVSRAHHHIIWSRQQSYREPMLDALMARDRMVFEHFTHDASILPMEFLPVWRRQFDRKRERIQKSNWFKGMTGEIGRKEILARVDREGPLSTRDFDTKINGKKRMWARPPHKMALDYLWYAGDLATSHRKGFTKYYDLAERVFPEHLLQQQLDDPTQLDSLCSTSLDRLVFGTSSDIKKFWEAADSKEVTEWLSQPSDRVPVQWQTHDGQWIAAHAPADIETRIRDLDVPTSRLRILSPFDPLIRDRTRLQRLFGFEYRVEMFVPAAKRVWGYYVYPMLEGERIVGRIEVQADRNKSVLTVSKIWAEPGIKWTTSRANKLQAELARLARLAEVDQVVWQCQNRIP